MGENLNAQMGSFSLDGPPTYERSPFGKAMLKHFLLDQEQRNLNHGSFGTFPRAVQQKQREQLEKCEMAPDLFIFYEVPRLLDVSREAVAKLLRAPVSTVVYVPNATTGVNTILRNMVWNEDGRDEILYFSTVYGAVGHTILYVCEANNNVVNPRGINLSYPVEDEDLITSFINAIQASKAEGKNPRVAIFDTVSSLPGVRVPFEALTAICREEGVISIVDGAHGIGHVPLDLSTLDPDFFVSNCHKWLFVPRGCAVLYVPERNQPLMRSTLPTSHGFVPRVESKFQYPLPPSSKSVFVESFEFVGTIDNSNYLVVGEAIKWRQESCGGEQAIMDYNSKLAREGGEAIAKILGTKILDNSTNTLTACCMVNVLLPITVRPEQAQEASVWMKVTIVKEFKTFIAIYVMGGQLWARLSGQIYLVMEDFEWAGRTLKGVCERAANGEFLEDGKQLN